MNVYFYMKDWDFIGLTGVPERSDGKCQPYAIVLNSLQ